MESFGWIILKSIFSITLWFHNVQYTLCYRWDWLTYWAEWRVPWGTKTRERSGSNPALLSGCSQGGSGLIQQLAHKRRVALTFGFRAWKKNKVRLPDSCTVVWAHTPLMGWKSDPLKLWPSTLCSLGFWRIISLLWKKGRWRDENAAGRGHAWVLFAELGSSFPQDVVRVLLDRACERKLLTFLSLWIITGIRHLGFRHKLKIGFGNFYKTWNSIFYSSHVMKVFSAASGSVYSWLQHWVHLPEPDLTGQEIWGLRPRRGVARCSRSHNHSLTKHGIFYF